ncbi:MAG: M20/M25/M40 family metallo-hydrolase [Gemmatimonadetes bacterium]|nr:M20/M25/M40 family metallo-hydrolase [Gemmatimonadota bacterium]
MDPIALTRELVQIDSPTGQEGAVGEFLSRALERLGYHVRRQEVTPGRWNVLALRETPIVFFSTHMDTVPPNLPFREDETHLHGRGTADAKGIAAAQIAAAEAMAAQGERRIALLFLVGEEYGSDGARAAESLEPKGRFMINGEPTENRLALGHKGSLYAKLTAKGRAAHSAYPEEGASAIERMLAALEGIRRIPLPADDVLGPGTLNIGTIKGGVRPNVIPDHCEAELLFRTVRDTTELRAAVARAARGEITIEFGVELPPIHLRPVPGFETSVVRFGTDLPFLSSWGEGFLIGPGSIKVAHTVNEKVAKRDLLDGVALYQRLASGLIAGGTR